MGDKQMLSFETDDYPFNLGSYTWKIDTTSADCQTWFDRGLIWSYAFHHAESERCFRHAAASDPSAAMPQWGIAYSAGPNYNKEWSLFDKEDLARSSSKCHEAAIKAVASAKTPMEVALSDAIFARFPESTPGDYHAWNRAYIDKMEATSSTYPDNLDILALFADSLMSLAPWQLWNLQTGAPNPDSRTLEIQGVLENARRLPGSNRHPGILHLYIHLMELSPRPELAMTTADLLRSLVPDGGHLNHMPGHIDLLVGDYRRAIDSNLTAIIGDEKYAALVSSTDFYTFYRLHNYTFPIYAGMFNGQLQVCLNTVERMERFLTDDFMRIPSPPMVDWMEGFKSFRLHVLIRFGKWDDLLRLPFPSDPAFYCVTTTMLHYGRGVAYSVLGDIPNAEAERDEFRQARQTVPPSRFEFPNAWSNIFEIAENMLTGELEYRRRSHDLAFTHLRQAIHLSDNLIYAEPWGWMQPPRHAALLLEQGHVEEAAKVYAADLGFDDSIPRALRHPNNVWALHGYHECLTRLEREAEARMLKPHLTLALAVADVQINASCACRTSSL